MVAIAHDRIERVLQRLARSRFRARFRLDEREIAYLDRKGMPIVLQEGRDMLSQRLAPAAPGRDGRQTPWRGHPVFVAQHATATCCRSCLHKWHAIDKGRELMADELDYVLAVIGRWLEGHRPQGQSPTARQLPLFDE
ncbi:MAG TPA: DUF4186 domain-containing protein [Pirellulales bacterium]|nr:DUF4186 domain-containing protein [Pirellulales bacterium]